MPIMHSSRSGTLEHSAMTGLVGSGGSSPSSARNSAGSCAGSVRIFGRNLPGEENQSGLRLPYPSIRPMA
jgi:hypothetical protein